MKKTVCAILVMVILVTSISFAETTGDKKALESALNYLAFTYFSYSGLRKQLEYEGFSLSESRYAADSCGADWFDQAAGSAKEYLALYSFSKSKLIDQLEFDGFTHDEATYGASIAYGEKAQKTTSTDISSQDTQTASASQDEENQEDESLFFQICDKYVPYVIDCSGKEIWTLKDTYDDTSTYQIRFDFTDGNQSLMFEEAGRCKVYFFVSDPELMSALFKMILLYKNISESLPEGKKLQYRLHFSDEENHIITAETITDYYSWVSNLDFVP